MKKMLSPVFAFLFALAGLLGVFMPPVSADPDRVRYFAELGDDDFNDFETIEEMVYYAFKQEDKFKLDPELPRYYSNEGCSITAGTNLMAWYNKQYPQLIPGHEAGYLIFGEWRWTTTNSYLVSLMQELETEMEVVNGGTTIAQYLSGLDAYVSGKGMTFTYNNIAGGNQYKNELKSGKLLSVFVRNFNTTSDMRIETVSPGTDRIRMNIREPGHVMAVYGYREISYFNPFGSLIRRDTYLYVNTGFDTLGLTCISSHCTLDGLYITHIS
jgi:hypothetical protein